MKDATPYRERPKGERLREAQCFRDILGKAPPVHTVLETFGGIGDTAEVLIELGVGRRIIASELDEETCCMYNKRHAGSIARCVHSDLFDVNWKSKIGSRDYGIVMDFNLFTLLRVRDPNSFVSKVLGFMPLKNAAWIEITDAAISKMHLNLTRAYKLSTLDEYWAEVLRGINDRTGREWRLEAFSTHSRASYLLLV